MTQLDRDQIAARLKQMPALPSAVTDLIASFGDDDVDVDHVARQIARDQGLTARVLRVANSSFYGLQSKVGTIQEAIVVLGFRAVRSLVLAVGVNGAFRSEQCPAFDVRSYLRHGIGVGLVARALAAPAGHNAELAFTAGLLHDIGELVLASNFPFQYGAVLAARKEQDCFMVEAERAVLGVDHAEVGGLLAETWRFPPALRDAVADHHAPAAAAADSLANLVHVADAVAHALGLSRSADELVMAIDPLAWSRLGIGWDACAAVLPKIEKEFDETCQALMV